MVISTDKLEFSPKLGLSLPLYSMFKLFHIAKHQNSNTYKDQTEKVEYTRTEEPMPCLKREAANFSHLLTPKNVDLVFLSLLTFPKKPGSCILIWSWSMFIYCQLIKNCSTCVHQIKHSCWFYLVSTLYFALSRFSNVTRNYLVQHCSLQIECTSCV